MRILAGRPLIVHTIDVALAASSIGRVIVSTDDQEIADVARRNHAEVPFMRPAVLAEDDTLDLPVFAHALTWLQEHESYSPEIVVHLRPTSPLRTARDVDEAVALLRRHPRADAVRAVSRPRENPFKMWMLESGRLRPLLGTQQQELFNQPRQALPDVLWQNGCIDVIRATTILSKKSMTGTDVVPFVMRNDLAIDLDSEADLSLAEFLFSQKRPVSR